MDIELLKSDNPYCTCVGGVIGDSTETITIPDPDCPIHKNKAVKELERVLKLLNRSW